MSGLVYFPQYRYFIFTKHTGSFSPELRIVLKFLLNVSANGKVSAVRVDAVSKRDLSIAKVACSENGFALFPRGFNPIWYPRFENGSDSSAEESCSGMFGKTLGIGIQPAGVDLDVIVCPQHVVARHLANRSISAGGVTLLRFKDVFNR